MQRSVLIIAIILGAGAIAYFAVRMPPPSATQQAVPAGEQLGPAGAGDDTTSFSGAGEWLMEGSDPGRTRATSAPLSLPLAFQRELGVAGAEDAGSPPVIAGGLLLLETPDDLRAFDLATGEQRWLFADKGAYISPAVAGKRVFFRSESANAGQVIALDLESGKKLWEFAPRRFSSASSDYFGGHLTSPVVVDNVVFVGAGEEVYALDAETGKERWVFAAQDLITSSATVASGHVYITDFRYCYAIDQRTGELRWAIPIDTAFSFSAVASGSTLLVTNGNKLVALDTATGVQRWQLEVPNVTLIPAAADGQRAYVKSTETLYVLDLAKGTELWRYHDTNFVSLPVLAGGQVFLISGMGGNTTLTALDAASGKQAWEQPVKKLSTTAPVIAGRAIYLRTTDGRILAYAS